MEVDAYNYVPSGILGVKRQGVTNRSAPEVF